MSIFSEAHPLVADQVSGWLTWGQHLSLQWTRPPTEGTASASVAATNGIGGVQRELVEPA